eukprot:CAMPEP_0172878872 /NCGR_PEP_ID=MMETSP1075-20121228/110815_1 /TAXON_ID=2916 /ORGANISM="Ceratium fusus, Strain PA161109" /LENGTH=436 /DNA_ID=CAMNT_0013730759 /DNA_START=1 /DNA_END=1311 /DNA_ORIENTATION=+
MHSSLFEAGGPPPQSVYTYERQRAMAEEVFRRKPTSPRQAPEVNLPSPADLKATGNAGHGVISWGGLPAEGDRTVQFGDRAQPLRVVSASRVNGGSLAHDLRCGGPNVNWMESRSPRPACRQQDSENMDANTRKMQDLSSEVLGGSRVVEKNTKIEKRAAADLSEVKPCFSARDSKSHNLHQSSENPFCKQSGTPPQEGYSEPKEEQARRRTERNFSDIFGSPRARPESSRNRTELHETANVSFLDPSVEISIRRECRSKENRGPVAAGCEAADIIYHPRSHHPAEVLQVPPPRVARARSPEEKRASFKERACWDTATIMDSGAEIARMNWERSLQRSEGCQQGTGTSSSRECSAQERKRVEMASGQCRLGTGAAPEPYDDGRAGPATSAPPPSRSRRGLVTDVAAAGAGCLGMPSKRADSARARKMISLRGSGIF